jgi:DNA-binding transcriptional regulator YiaG
MVNDKIRPNRIKVLRERSRLTQRELALLMGTDDSTVAKHEAASRGLTPDEIRKYSRIFKCESYELFLEAQPG